MPKTLTKNISSIFLSEGGVAIVILINAIAIFTQGFPSVEESTKGILSVVDTSPLT